MLILYTLPGCSYCMRVKSAFLDIGVQYEERSITEGANREDLRARGGKMQTPFLIDDEHNVAMYESQDIVNYVRGLRAK